MRRRVRDHTSDRDAQPRDILFRRREDRLHAISDVLLEVVLSIVGRDLRVVEQRGQRGAAEEIVERGAGMWRRRGRCLQRGPAV